MKGWHNEPARHALAARGMKTIYGIDGTHKQMAIELDDDLPSSLLKKRIFYRGDHFADDVMKGKLDHSFATWMVNKYGKEMFFGRLMDHVWWSVWDEPDMKILMPTLDFFNKYSIIGLIGTKDDVIKFMMKALREIPTDDDFQEALSHLYMSDFDGDEMIFYVGGEGENTPEGEWLMDAWDNYTFGSSNGLFLASDIGGWYEGPLNVDVDAMLETLESRK